MKPTNEVIDSMEQVYPDISDLFAAKVRRRRELAALSWEEKVRIIEQMQRLLPKDAWQSGGTRVTPTHTAARQSG